MKLITIHHAATEQRGMTVAEIEAFVRDVTSHDAPLAAGYVVHVLTTPTETIRSLGVTLALNED